MKRHWLWAGVALAAFTVMGGNRELTVAPGQGTFIWLDSKVPKNNRDKMVFTLDLPNGVGFRKDGYISARNYTAGPGVRTGEVETAASPDHPGYKRTTLTFSFGQLGPVPLQPQTTYEIKLRMRWDLQGSVDVLTSWYAHGGLNGYRNTGVLKGKSDWTDVTYTEKAGESDKMHFWFNRWAGAEVNGEIEIQSFEIWANGKKMELNGNDFSKGIGGWAPGIARHNPETKTITFTFHGTSAQGSYYSEYGYVKPGTEFRSAPFFRVAPITPDGDYPIYLSGPGVRETIMLKVRRAKPVLPKNVEAALWICESPFWAYSDTAKEATLDACRSVGINTMYVDGPTPGGHLWGTDFNAIKLDDDGHIGYLADRGFKVFGYVPYEVLLQRPLTDSYLEKHPEARAQDWAGRPMHRVCSSYLLHENPEFWQAAETVSTRAMQETKLSGLYWDVECLSPLPYLQATQSGGEDNMSTCFCPRCIQRFKQEYGISNLAAGKMFGTQLPYNYQKMSADVQNVIKRYPMEWTQFSLNRIVWQVQKLQAAVKAGNPDGQMRVYTGRYNQGRWDLPEGGILRWSEFCGVDWTRMPQYTDTIMGCHDLEFYPETESILLRELSGRKQPVILDISTLGYYGSKHKDYYARIMHIFAFCEAQGFGIWGFWELDGCDFTEISRAMQDVAKLEDFFTSGRRLDSLHKLATNGKEVYAASWILGTKRAVFICNRGKEKAHAEVTLLGMQPAAKSRYRAALLDGTKLENPEKIVLDLPPATMKIAVIEDVSFPQKGN